MQIRLNRLHFPVTSLGPGKRVGIWLQGCGIGCPNCVSRDTWAKDDDLLTDIDVVLDWCRGQTASAPEGVTISGGEPFEQPVALAALLDGLAAWRTESGLPIDFLCYSGFRFARLNQEFVDILARLDAVIPEPFVEGRPTRRILRGSSNQTLIALSPLGHRRYDALVDHDAQGKGSFQVQIQAGRIWFIGIPRHHDMDALEQACRSRGVIAEKASWRA